MTTEQQNWELMGPVYKQEAEDLRKSLQEFKNNMHTLEPFFEIISEDISHEGIEAFLTLLELAK